MKVILDSKYKSFVVGWGPAGIDAGPVPRNIGIERMRYDGTSLVDIGVLTAIYVVEEALGVFSLHAKPVPRSQLVSMSYLDRRNLVNDNGTFRVKTPVEIALEKKQSIIKGAEDRAKLALDKQVGVIVRQFLFTHKLIYALVWALRSQNPQGLQFVDSYISEMNQIFDIADPSFKSELVDEYTKFKVIIKDYLDTLSALESSSSSSSSSSSKSSESSSSSSSESSSSSSSESSSSSS